MQGLQTLNRCCQNLACDCLFWRKLAGNGPSKDRNHVLWVASRCVFRGQKRWEILYVQVLERVVTVLPSIFFPVSPLLSAFKNRILGSIIPHALLSPCLHFYPACPLSRKYYRLQNLQGGPSKMILFLDQCSPCYIPKRWGTSACLKVMRNNHC